MAGHGFCRADRYLIGIIAEHGFDGNAFELVSELSGGSVGIDVAHFSWRDACVLDRHLHASRSSFAIWGWCGYMVSVTRRSIADHFCIDAGTSLHSGFHFLEDDDTGALAHDEPVSFSIEGTACALRFIVPC